MSNMLVIVGRVMDALVAERVMELPNVGRYSRPDLRSLEWFHHGINDDAEWYCQLNHEDNPRWVVPSYSTDIAAAWQVFEYMRADNDRWQNFARHLPQRTDGVHIVLIPDIRQLNPETICRAALRAVGVNP